MARRKRPTPSTPPKSDPKARPAEPTLCYLCGRPIQPEDKIAQAHELVMHRTCYDADLRKGRTPGEQQV